MGGVSADGKVLWLSGRYNADVYAIDTDDGKLLARIPVGRGPMDYASIHSQDVIPWGTRVCFGRSSNSDDRAASANRRLVAQPLASPIPDIVRVSPPGTGDRLGLRGSSQW